MSILSLESPILRIRNRKPRSRKSLVFTSCALYLLIHLFCFASPAQEVTVITNDGSEITGSLLEYKDGKLKMRAWNEILEIPAEDLAMINFLSDKIRVSGDAYRHMLSGDQLLELGMEDEALEEFKAAIRISPMYADAHYRIGDLLSKRGQKKEGLEYISRAIKLNPNLSGKVRYFMEIGDEYFAAGDFENAAKTYYLLYGTYSTDPAAEDAIYKAGFLFAEQLRNNQKALEVLDNALLAFPTSQHAERALYEVGRMRSEEGLPEQAEHSLLRLVSEFPAGRWANDAHYTLGKVYTQMSRNKDAIQEYARVMDKTTDTRLSAAADRMLNQCIWSIYNSSDGLPGNDIGALAQDGRYIWIGTTTGITRLDLYENKFSSEGLLDGTDILALAVDDIHLWIGTRDDGLRRYNKLQNTWAPYTENEELSSVSVSAISVDPDNVWVGTARNGLYHYDRLYGAWTRYTIGDGLSSNQIVSIASTLNGIWCGTWENGGCFFNAFTGRWQPVADISAALTVTSIAAGADYVWFAWYGESSNGASKYDVTEQAWEQHRLKFGEGEATVEMINLAANDTEVWVGTDAEAMLYDYRTSRWLFFAYPQELSDSVTKCVLISDDSVWFGTPRGLGKLDRKLSKRIEHIRREHRRRR